MTKNALKGVHMNGNLTVKEGHYAAMDVRIVLEKVKKTLIVYMNILLTPIQK